MYKIPNFVTHDQGDGTMLYGSAAMKELLKALEAKAASDDEHIGLSDIEPLQLYSFALDASEKARVEALVVLVLGSSSSLAQQQQQQQPSENPWKKRRADSERDLTASLFD